MAQYSDILLTVDFDRTLTGPDTTIPRRNIDAIKEFMAKGGVFTVNTGRSAAMFRLYMDQIPANAPFLLYNGSAAYDPVSDSVSLCFPIERDMWQVLEQIAPACEGLNLELQGVDAHYSYAGYPMYGQFYDRLGSPWGHLERGKDYSPFLKLSIFGTVGGTDVVAQLYEGTAEELARFDRLEQTLRDIMGSYAEVFRSAPRVIDIHAKGVSKINAARALQKKLGRKILVCVGDAENDISMLEGADYAYCPEDGVVADRFENVCCCAEGAIADVIYKKIPEILAEHS